MLLFKLFICALTGYVRIGTCIPWIHKIYEELSWLPETCINILIAHFYSCPQDYIYLEPVQCKPQVHLCNRGICDRQLTACRHLLPIPAVQVITSYSSIDILLVSVHQVLTACSFGRGLS